MHSGAIEKQEFIKQLEDAIEQAAQVMASSVTSNDMGQFQGAAEAWRLAQETWLQATQDMSPEKAHAAMVGFSMGGDLAKWQEQKEPGPPPSILSLYRTT
ncbi:MAG TPA: hypothetical protein VN207_09960 [Ktedonobacteraceae bacterium]|nr:hypothetical protein [Ktedonobacteraceae bacterium]